jgi:hypothetical protein
LPRIDAALWNDDELYGADRSNESDIWLAELKQ